MLLRYPLFLGLLFISTLGFAQQSLPIGFEDSNITYPLTSFEGAVHQVIDNFSTTSGNESDRIVEVVKGNGVNFFAGTYLDLDDPINVSTTPVIIIDAWSPKPDLPVRISLENSGGTNQISVDLVMDGDATWETLTADFSGLIEEGEIYQRITINFEFEVNRAGDGTSYYFDNVNAIAAGGGGDNGGPVGLPVSFEDSLDYDLTGLFGVVASLVPNPQPDAENASGTVASALKLIDAPYFAEAILVLDEPIDFSVNRAISVQTWSPKPDLPIRMTLESADGNNEITADVITTRSNIWETQVFNFQDVINDNVNYQRLIIQFEYVEGLDGDGVTYYFDNIEMADAQVEDPVILPLTFEDSIDYNIENFVGAVALVTDNPAPSGINQTDKVLEINKEQDAQFFAGSVIRLDEPIVFGEFEAIGIQSWSPKAGVPVRLAIEDASGGNQVFLDLNTTVANQWETLVFPIGSRRNPGVEYVRLVIIPEFVPDLPGDGSTYYFDNIGLTDPEPLVHVGLPLTFESERLNYNYTTFEGANSSIVLNPVPSEANNSKHVVQTVKVNGAQYNAGTKFYLDQPIDFSESEMIFFQSWSPKAGIPVRVLLESTAGGEPIFAEVNTTLENDWEQLSVDFAGNQDAEVLYNEITFFFEYIEGTTGDNSFYYLDNVSVGQPVSVPVLARSPIAIFPNPTAGAWTLRAIHDRIDRVELFDVSGRRVFASSPRANFVEVPAATLPAGAYFLRVTTPAGTRMDRVIRR